MTHSLKTRRSGPLGRRRPRHRPAWPFAARPVRLRGRLARIAEEVAEWRTVREKTHAGGAILGNDRPPFGHPKPCETAGSGTM